MEPVDLYDTYYTNYSDAIQRAVRVETYGEDLGQSSWMTADELRHFALLLGLHSSHHVLEIGSGSGGTALFLAATYGCQVTGVDINEAGIQNSNALARDRHQDSRVMFCLADASRPLPFDDNRFDIVFSNDAIVHVPGRLDVLREWHRVLKPGGQMLFTDALIVTGLVTHQEIATRSSIGYYIYSPPGVNEHLIAEAGFELVCSEDTTASAAAVARRWYEARVNHREHMIRIEGEINFTGLQKFLWSVYTLCSEGRLSRYMYLGRKS